MGEARAVDLLRVLEVDPNWRLNRVSSGQRKRIQLWLNLIKYKEVLLLDEVTADLDVVQRQVFLNFLYEESNLRGCTVIYATHILEGMHGWATHLLLIDAATQGCRLIACRPEDDELHEQVAALLASSKSADV
eukprot:NODE_2323_length_801_cov_192.585106_g1616_i0.p2 GENE.NODE_2323_length_801_cov_192.585106_g1616_i0~~NODE_2323_length_801_cov_192.585106_g1616_i0.p2  ORF type:complete len:140 (-),score=50.55 NODE_2323_length_801_cov_192.585106_g1616_i0:380-778(-)